MIFLPILACQMWTATGPLAGALRMRYPHFLAANASGAIFWAGGTPAVV